MNCDEISENFLRVFLEGFSEVIFNYYSQFLNSPQTPNSDSAEMKKTEIISQIGMKWGCWLQFKRSSNRRDGLLLNSPSKLSAHFLYLTTFLCLPSTFLSILRLVFIQDTLILYFSGNYCGRNGMQSQGK